MCEMSFGSFKIVRDPSFGERVTATCDRDPNVPPPNFGRLGWIRDQMQAKFNESVSIETIRKWLAGEVKPKPERIAMLAELFNVDRAWLAFGSDPEMTQRDKRRMNTEGDGATVLLAGLIKMAGGQAAFPEEDDKRAADNSIDIYAWIKGGKYDIHVCVGQEVPGGNIKFLASANYEGVVQIGVIATSDFAVRLIDIPEEHIAAAGRRRGGSTEVVLTADQIAEFEIKSLRSRL